MKSSTLSQTSSHLDLVDLTSDPKNANRGTARGRDALAHSLRAYGAGRAVLIDRHGCVIAGNKTVEQAKRLRLPLRVVKTDAHHLIAVQRADRDLAPDPRARPLAIADNRVGELDLEWDVDRLKQRRAEGLDLSAFWTDAEFAELFADPQAGLTDENAVVEPGPTDIGRGELFVLGRHRLRCGDATSAGDVTRLLSANTPRCWRNNVSSSDRGDMRGRTSSAPRPQAGRSSSATGVSTPTSCRGTSPWRSHGTWRSKIAPTTTTWSASSRVDAVLTSISWTG